MGSTPPELPGPGMRLDMDLAASERVVTRIRTHERDEGPGPLADRSDPRRKTFANIGGNELDALTKGESGDGFLQAIEQGKTKGKMHFDSTGREARFMRVRLSSDESELEKDAERCWKVFRGSAFNLQEPSILLEVTGSAGSLEVRPRLQDLFSHGLAKAAQATNAWVFTGGTESGVMQL
eukprot:119818-Prymnesium_polylepis.1